MNSYSENQEITPRQSPKQSIIQQRREKARQQQRELRELGNQHWKSWKNNYSNDTIALAELIQYINRYSKRYAPYKQRNRREKKLVFYIYWLKEDWCRKNKNYIIQAYQSAEFTYTQTDSNDLKDTEKITKKSQDSEDFTSDHITRFYFYVFLINGQEYRFHSKNKLVANCEFKQEAHGSSEPLKDQEITLRIVPALLASFFALKAKKIPKHLKKNHEGYNSYR
ncbi:hypothetical protein cce_5068 [Crocosphaera subtropica ATCC 51142]|uniref:Uncharacterized protein n=1 Tax=Crocosphaera subtropica (strain ATCC 51142 / BH68) TaxID=43989 RepID=B1X2Q3_CROS5|nr:hypothetical protein [Crocosphaera subtropica]ACB54414.1 hypothetical protein cce_5068 [Crocosphaera subtropica ATCC 51142]